MCTFQRTTRSPSAAHNTNCTQGSHIHIVLGYLSHYFREFDQNNIFCNIWQWCEWSLLNAFNKKIRASPCLFSDHFFFYLICAAIDALLCNKCELHGRFVQYLIIGLWRNDTCLLSIKWSVLFLFPAHLVFCCVVLCATISYYAIR